MYVRVHVLSSTIEGSDVKALAMGLGRPASRGAKYCIYRIQVWLGGGAEAEFPLILIHLPRGLMG
jgi:hypothetical protein